MLINIFTMLKIKLSELSEVTQSCPTLCDFMDGSLPDSSFHRIFQARVLEWVAISFSRSSQPRDQTQVSHIVGRHFTIWATREEILNVSKIYTLPINSRLVHLCIFQYVNYRKIITTKAYHNSKLGGKFKREETWIPMADSCWYLAETNTIL